MGRRPPKNPEVPKVEGTSQDAAPEGDNKGGTVRKKRGGSKGKSTQNMSLAVEALEALSQGGADPASLKKAYASAVEVYGADELNAAMQAKGMNLAEFAPASEVAQPSTNMVTQNTVTTGSVVPVTSADESLPAVPAVAATSPTPEQTAALQALGLNKGGKPPAPAAVAPPAPSANDPRRPLTIKNMADMLAMDALDYRKPVDVPPVMVQERTVDPADVAGQPTVQTRVGQYEKKPPTQPFKFPQGMDFGSDDGRVQLADTDYSNMRPTVVDPQASLQWYARQNQADTSGNPRQLSGKTEPDKPDPFADIPVDPNQGLVYLRRNRANILNRAIPIVAAGAGMGGFTAATIYGLSQMLKGEPAQPQPQGQDPDEAILMNSNTVGGFR